MKIKIFVTGGTFDKEYNKLTGKLFFRDTHLDEMLALGRSRVPVDHETLMMIDSLDMSDTQRREIVNHIDNCSAERIIVTHGTDTMVTTAKYIAEYITNKTVILVGAIIPYKFGSSDGLFNLGSALAFAQTLTHGTYVSMNGRYFNHDNCVKNKSTGEFEVLR